MRSALLSLRYPLVLKGTNIFQGNQGGAVTLTQAHMDTFGSIRFEGNTAESGGAVTLLDKSTVWPATLSFLVHICGFMQMDLGNDTEMVFRENKADEHGGAINVLSTPLIGDIREFFATEKDCFFLHSSAKASNQNCLVLNLDCIYLRLVSSLSTIKLGKRELLFMLLILSAALQGEHCP